MLKRATTEAPRARVIATSIDERGAAIIAERYGRIAFGLTLIAGFVAMAVTTLATSQNGAIILVATWLAALTAMLVGRRIARHAARRGMLHTWPSLGASLAASSAGLILVLPLTLPAPIALAAAGFHGVDAWLHVNLTSIGFALVVCASIAAYRGFLLPRGEKRPSLETVLKITVAASLVPYVITFVLVGPIVGVCILVLGRQDRLLADSEHVQMA